MKIIITSMLHHTRLVLTVLAAIFLTSVAPQRAQASASASDNANNDNIGSGNNGGTGFAAWSNPQTGGGGGVFTGSYTGSANHGSPGIDTSSKSWGMYCNGSTVGANYSRMTRQFTAGSTPSAALQPNQTFTIDMDNGFITTSGIIGFSLQNSSGNDVLSFKFTGGGSTYQINGSNPGTTIGYTANGLRVKVTLTSSTAYSVSAFEPNTSSTVIGPNTGSLMSPTGGQAIDRVILYTDGTGTGSSGAYDMFFNSMSISCPSFTITTQPGNQTVCSGTTAGFTVAATSASTPTYQWQFSPDTGTTWINVTNGTGGTTASYTTAATTSGMNSYKYRCAVTDACGTTVNSDGTATLTVNTAVNIGTEPTDQTVCTAGTATFNVAATGTGLTYQWQKYGTNISNGDTGNGSTYGGVTTATLGITNAVAADAVATVNGFACVVSGTSPCAAATTTPRAALTVTASIVVNTQPTAQTACSTPGTASYSIAVTAANPTYQWNLNGVPLSNGAQGNGSTVAGATSATLSLSTLTSANTVAAGSGYDCTVSSTCGSPVTSSRVALTVSTVPTITVQPTAQTACSTPGTASFSVTATGDGLTYQWRTNGVNISGATSSTLNLSGLTSANTVAAGVGYDCVVSGTSPCASTNSTRVALTVSPASVGGTVTNSASTICSGSSVTLTNTGFTGTNQWQSSTDGVNFTPISNATNATYTASPTQTTYYYSIMTSGVCSPANSTTNTVTVNTAPAVTTHPQSTNACLGSTANFTVAASGTSPTCQWRKGHWGTDWLFPSGTASIGLGNSTLNAGGSSGGINSSSPAQAWKMTNSASTVEVTRVLPYANLAVGQTFQIDMDNGYLNSLAQEGFELKNASSNVVWSIYFRGGDSFYTINAGTVSPASNIPFTGDGLRITFSLTSASTYTATIQILAGANVGTYGPFTGNLLNPTGGQAITRFRLYMSGNPGQGANSDLYFNNLVVGDYADNAGNYSSWTGDSSGKLLTDTDNISGSTTTTLTINPVRGTNAVNYDVIVSNSCGTATSSVAALTVNALPSATITAPSSVCANTPSHSASVADAGVGATYGWTITGDGTIDSGATSSSISFSAGGAGTLTLSCSVTNASGCTASGTSNVTAIANSAIQNQPQSTNVCQGTTATFTISATGVDSYQWQISTDGGSTWNDITGATTTSYSTNPVAAANGNEFQVVLAGCSGNLTSSPALLTVYPTSVGGNITGASTVCIGSGTTLTLNSSTGNIQWQSRTNGNAFADISGQTSATLATGNLTTNTDFRAVVTSGTCSSAFSTTNTITVNPASIGGTVTMSASTICSGSSVTLTNTGFTGANQWQASPDGVTFTNIPGATSATYTTPALTQTTYYYSVVTSGACSSANSTTNTVTVNTAPAITAQPASSTNCSGTSANFTVAASGTPLNYAWRKNGSGWGASGAWIFGNGGATISQGGFFISSAANNGGNGSINTGSQSWGMYANSGKVVDAVRSFNAIPTGRQLRLSMANGLIESGGTVGFGLRNSSGNNLFEVYFLGQQSGYRINDATGEHNSGIGFTRDGVGIVFVLTSSTNYSVTITTNGVSSTFTGSLMNPAGGQSITQLRLFDANAGSGGDHDTYFNSVNVPGGYDDNAAAYSTQSGNVGWLYTAANDNNGGQGPLSDGGGIGGSSTATLTLTNVTTSDNGSQYSCSLNNSCGIDISTAATLTVNQSPSAANDSYNRVANIPYKIAKTNLLANDSVGAGFSSATSPTANGVTFTENATYIFYPSNAPNSPDSFTYTVTNASGCSATATVSINLVQASSVQSISFTNGGSSVTANFAGIPTYPYAIERATNVTFTLGTNTWFTNAPAGGLFQFTDTFSDLGATPPSEAYYRLRYNP